MGHRYRFAVMLLAAGAVLAGCGKEIGDDCVFASDCSPDGDRICDLSSAGGYCTVQGCDLSTCPDEAVCVQFFTGSFSNRVCDPAALSADCRVSPQPADTCCTLDELCALDGRCVPRSSETRYCMRTCGGNGDCREGYECRDIDLMIEHGGQPLMPPDTPVDGRSPKFCAPAL